MTSRLLGLRIEDFKPLSLIEMTFDEAGGTFVVAGENEAGKTSVFDAIELLISGRKAPTIKRPVRDGADVARIIGTFDDLVVTRLIKANGTTSIKACGIDGRPFTRSEDVLKSLYNHIAIDPFAFSRLKEAEQVATLLDLIGFDPSALDEEYSTRFAQRTVENGAVASLKARLAAAPTPAVAPPSARVNVAALMADLEAARTLDATRGAAAANVAMHEADVATCKERIEAAKVAVERAEAALVEEEAVLAAAIAASASVPRPIDVAPILAAIESADEVNTAILQVAARAGLQAEVADAAALADASTARLVAIKAEKAATLAAATMPVPNLTIDPDTDTLLLNGFAFADCSSGVKVRTGVAIAMALDPDLKFIGIRDASLLDSGNRAVINELAVANGFTVLMEMAGEGIGAGAGILISGGVVTEVHA
jgi:hypothetical protein